MNSVARGSREYLQWKNDILKKYNSKCVLCNSLDRIDVHHILPYKKYPHFAIHPENGVTLCYDCHRYVHLNGHDFSVFLPDDLLNTFMDYHKSMFVDGIYHGYDIDLLPRRIMMQTIHYIQIDVAMLDNTKCSEMMERFGSKFIAVYLECLKAMTKESVHLLCSIEIDDFLAKHIARKIYEDKEIVMDVLTNLIDIGLLIRLEDSDRYYSNGFMNRVGKHLISNEERSKKQKENARKKKLEDISNIDTGN
jgi:hypothetical protein